MKLPKQSNALNRRGIVIVPLLDVVLNLLVIFIYVMLSMQIYQGVPVQLPWAHGEKQSVEKNLMLQLNAQGQIYMNGSLLSEKQLDQKLQKVSRTQKIQLAADQKINYGQVMRFLDRLRGLGFKQIALLTRNS